jgi:methionyl-tRNA synthetase
VTVCNAYIEMTAPWKMAKDPERADTLDHTLFALAEALRIIATLTAPVLPSAARQIFYQLNCPPSSQLTDATWGGLASPHHLGKPVPVFPRIEVES